MKTLNCPLNGPRNISEFIHGGELKTMPDPAACSDREWAEHVFFQDNLPEVVTEWWFHGASGYWFLAERHLLTDEVLRTFDPGELFRQRIEFSREESTS